MQCNLQKDNSLKSFEHLEKRIFIFLLHFSNSTAKIISLVLKF